MAKMMLSIFHPKMWMLFIHKVRYGVHHFSSLWGCVSIQYVRKKNIFLFSFPISNMYMKDVNAMHSISTFSIGSDNFRTHTIYALKCHKTPTAIALVQQFAQQPALGHFPPLVLVLGQPMHLCHLLSCQSHFEDQFLGTGMSRGLEEHQVFVQRIQVQQ